MEDAYARLAEFRCTLLGWVTVLAQLPLAQLLWAQPRQGSQGEGLALLQNDPCSSGKPWLFCWLCVGRACFVQRWKSTPAADVGWWLWRGEGFVLGKEGTCNLLPAAPASPGNLSSPHAPTHEQKIEFISTG